MTIKCELTEDEVYKIISDELTKRGLKVDNLKAKICPSMQYDIRDYFGGVTFEIITDK